MFNYQIVLLTHNRDTFNKLKSKNRFEIGHLERKLWSFFKALSFEFALALFTARHFYLEFCRSPKSRMFIDQIVFLTRNRDTFNKLKSKNRFEIGHLEQKLWSFFKALSFENCTCPGTLWCKICTCFCNSVRAERTYVRFWKHCSFTSYLLRVMAGSLIW